MEKQIAKMEDEATYSVTTAPAVSSDDAIIAKALAILDSRMRKTGQAFNCPDDVKAYCCLNIGNLPHEVFGVLFLDAQHRLLAYEEMFRGTITQTSVYPREVLKAAIAHNAVAVILTHNHPSGSTDPSRADTELTSTLRSALALVDVKVLDHVIVSGGQSLSMAERGLV